MQVAVKIMKSSPIGRLNRGFGNTGRRVASYAEFSHTGTLAFFIAEW